MGIRSARCTSQSLSGSVGASSAPSPRDANSATYPLRGASCMAANRACRDRCYTVAGRDRGGMTDQGNQLALSTGLDPQDAEAVLGVLVRDALDQAGEHLAIRWPGLVLHSRRDTLGVASQRT